MSRLQRLEVLVKELSFQNDPDRLVRAFGQQNALFHDNDGFVSVNNRELEPPAYRISRSWRWRNHINLYTEAHLLPKFEGGLLGELLYGGRARRIDRLSVEGDDPAAEHFEGMLSLACAPSFLQGRPVGLSVLLHRLPAAFQDRDLETLLVNTNLLGRAAGVLSLAQQLEQAYRRLDHEMQQVGRMQRHLLPVELPRPDGLRLAASYVTSSQAGGDYYDVLPLSGDRWLIFLADVSGHGVPSAVVVSILHTLLHAAPGEPTSPEEVMRRLNEHLISFAPDGVFATALCGIYDANRRRLRFSNAGHPQPRLRRKTTHVDRIESPGGLPLGVLQDGEWPEGELALRTGDTVLFFTDGLIEGTNPAGEQFGNRRLDDVLRMAPLAAGPLVQHVERQFHDFCAGAPELDDRTLLAAVAVP